MVPNSNEIIGISPGGPAWTQSKPPRREPDWTEAFSTMTLVRHSYAEPVPSKACIAYA